MNCTIKYPSRREAGGKERYFSRICPTSSKTVEKQRNQFSPPGLTVVAYIPHADRKPFAEAISLLGGLGYPFTPFEQLHFTVLGLFAGEQSLPPQDLDRLIAMIGVFVQKISLTKLIVEFDFLRPGIFVGQEGCSDGTVVAMAEESVDKKIVGYSKELAGLLAKEFASYFPEAKRRPLGGVWCTLGYFDGPDFSIDEPVCGAFETLKKFKATVQMREIAVTEFSLKSLADGIPRAVIRL